jgi:diguanylate cyclase (GGDEF)-like protein/PAS domain S-box-containing protein
LGTGSSATTQAGCTDIVVLSARILKRILGGAGLRGWFGAFSALLVIWSVPVAHAADEPTVSIGVIAFRDLETTARQWEPLGEFLNERIPGRRFAIRPLYIDDLSKAVALGDVAFVLTQPEHYVILREQFGLAAVATLVTRAGNAQVARLGGVIVTRASRNDIRELADLRGRAIAAIAPNSLGGFRAQQWVLHQAGIDIEQAAQMAFIGPPQDKVIGEVLAGRADIGFVRTGLLESMIEEGKLQRGALKVINLRKEPGFPLLLSTDLYPEWPFSARRGLPDALVKEVTMALLQFGTNGTPAGPRIAGFSPPADYAPLERMLYALGAHPDRAVRFNLRDIVAKYPTEIVSGLVVLLAGLLAFSALLYRSGRRVSAALNERASLLDSLGEGVYGVDQLGLCTFINPKALAMLGWERDQIVGKNQHALFHFQRPDGTPYPATECPVYHTLKDGKRREGEEWFIRADRTGFPVFLTVTPIETPGRRAGAVVTFRDITADREAEQLVRIAAIAFETQEAIAVTDSRGRILRVNGAFSRITGYSPEEAVGNTLALLKSGRHGDDFYRALWQSLTDQGHWHGEIWNKRKSGEIYPEWLSISAVHGQRGETTHFVASFIDISERKAAEDHIQLLAFYDPLTQLPNRSLLHDRLTSALVSAERHRRHAALLFIDLDNFKTLNDSMGHDVGDLLLREAAQRLRLSVRAGDTVARLGGDEFIVLLEDLAFDLNEAVRQINHIGREILRRLGQPYEFVSVVHHSTASIGAVPFRDRGWTVDSVLKAADLAMYKAKEAGKNVLCFFDPEMQTEVEQRAVLEREMRDALAQGQFILHYQPQVDRDGRPLGAEALIRWQHPARGLIHPADFIRLAEETRLIVPIGRWVLDEACRQLAAWKNDPATERLTLAINVSPLQFRDPGFTSCVAEALRESGAPARQLKLEITESLFLADVANTIERLATLKRELGVGLSLDDFGTGYSSLNYLKQLPIDQVKIDRSFVSDVHCNTNDAAIAAAVIALGQTFGLEIVAEGVETAEQRDALLALGYECFQGHFYGHPVPIADFPVA